MTTERCSDIEALMPTDDPGLLSVDFLHPAEECPIVYAEIHITNRCNAGCRFCNQSPFKMGGAQMSTADFGKLLGELTALGLRGVRLSGGGEPSFHPEILSILTMTRKARIRLMRFDTNGILLDERLAEELVQSDVRIMHLSLIAPNAPMWAAETKRRPDEFDTLLRQIQRFRQMSQPYRTRVYVSFVIDEITCSALLEMEELAHELGVGMEIHDLNNYAYSTRFLEQDLAGVIDQLDLLSTETIQRRFYLASLSALEAARRVKAGTHQPSGSQAVCSAPWLGMLVQANGDAHPCCAIAGSRERLGNVWTSSVASIRAGLPYTALRDEAQKAFLMQERGNAPRCLISQCYGKCGPRVGMYGHEFLSQLSQRFRLSG